MGDHAYRTKMQYLETQVGFGIGRHRKHPTNNHLTSTIAKRKLVVQARGWAKWGLCDNNWRGRRQRWGIDCRSSRLRWIEWRPIRQGVSMPTKVRDHKSLNSGTSNTITVAISNGLFPMLSLYTWELQLRIISNIDRNDKQYSFHRASTAPLLDAPANPNLKIPTRRYRQNILRMFSEQQLSASLTHYHGYQAVSRERPLCASSSLHRRGRM